MSFSGHGAAHCWFLRDEAQSACFRYASWCLAESARMAQAGDDLRAAFYREQHVLGIHALNLMQYEGDMRQFVSRVRVGLPQGDEEEYVALQQRIAGPNEELLDLLRPWWEHDPPPPPFSPPPYENEHKEEREHKEPESPPPPPPAAPELRPMPDPPAPLPPAEPLPASLPPAEPLPAAEPAPGGGRPMCRIGSSWRARRFFMPAAVYRERWLAVTVGADRWEQEEDIRCHAVRPRVCMATRATRRSHTSWRVCPRCLQWVCRICLRRSNVADDPVTPCCRRQKGPWYPQ